MSYENEDVSEEDDLDFNEAELDDEEDLFEEPPYNEVQRENMAAVERQNQLDPSHYE